MFALSPPNKFPRIRTQLLEPPSVRPDPAPFASEKEGGALLAGVCSLELNCIFCTLLTKQMFALNAKKTNLRSPVQFLPPWTKDISLSVDRMFPCSFVRVVSREVGYSPTSSASSAGAITALPASVIV